MLRLPIPFARSAYAGLRHIFMLSGRGAASCTPSEYLRTAAVSESTDIKRLVAVPNVCRAYNARYIKGMPSAYVQQIKKICPEE